MSQITFHYRAIDRQGKTAKGTLVADDRNEAYRQINASGLRPIKIRAIRARRGRRSVTLKDLSQLTYQFAVLTKARIPLVDGLRSIAEQETNQRLRDVVMDMAQKIEGGNTITSAMEPHREVFGDVYIETIRAAEASGSLIEILENLSGMLEREYEMKKNTKGALMYPACVVIALGLAMCFLMTVIIPRFAVMFSSRGVELPLPTQILLWGSGFIMSYWIIMLLGIIGAIWGVRKAWRNPSSRCRIDHLLHRIPLIRDILQGVAISRFAQVLSISLRSGLGLIDALEMSGKASGRPMLQEDAKKMCDQVRGGGRLREVMISCTYFPPFTRRMLSAGEEAADLSKMCEIVAKHYDREVTYLSKNIATAIEPILIVGLASIVLVVALAIFLPLWSMGALVG